jgi:hypothetical protein
MRPAGATNLKWSMADIDFLVGLARSGRTAAEICERVSGRGIIASPEEIRELCWQSGITVRSAPRVAQ